MPDRKKIKNRFNPYEQLEIETSKAIESLESKPFWYSERMLFLANLAIFFIAALGLYFVEKDNAKLGSFTSFFDFLFNSVSVGTLTGLFRGDSGNYSFLGQAILLANMVFSGIAVSIVGVLLILFVRVGLDTQKSLATELQRLGINSGKVILYILIDLLIVWGFGTLLFKFFGMGSWWGSIFNSASHIFNDGITSNLGNMVPFKNNPGILFSGIFLVTVGGLGIGIRSLFYERFLKLFRLNKLASQIPSEVIAPVNFTIIILIATIFLQFIGTLALYKIEAGNPLTFADGTFSEWDKIVNSHYMSTSARTAGFTTLPDLSKALDSSWFVLMGLMTVGASSGSFAGGILKLTVFIYLFIYVLSKLRGDKEVKLANGWVHLSDKTLIESNFRLIGFSAITLSLCFLMFLFSPQASGSWLFFEVISAVSNTGLSLGATPILNNFEMTVIMFLMIIGKIGFISFVISFFPKLQKLLSEAPIQADEFPVD